MLLDLDDYSTLEGKPFTPSTRTKLDEGTHRNKQYYKGTTCLLIGRILKQLRISSRRQHPYFLLFTFCLGSTDSLVDSTLMHYFFTTTLDLPYEDLSTYSSV